MVHTIWKRLLHCIFWCLIMLALAGCGMQLYQADSPSTGKMAAYRIWLQAGFPVIQTDMPVSLRVWRVLTGINPGSTKQQIAGGFPFLQDEAYGETEYVTEEETFYASAFITDGWNHRFEKIKGVTLSEEVQVLLYHTHNAETYQPSDGVSKVSGQNGGVVKAAGVFQEALQQKYGIHTIHNTTLHDYPNWNRSYQNSLATLQQLLKSYPEVKAVFDVHRDAGFTSKKPTTASINGKNAARIMLVVGANHENWKENLDFARRLETVCDELYPGLLRDNIHIKETGRYNQQAHPRAVLLEIGSDLNTQEEADYALECFSHVVYEVLKSK